MSQFPCLRQLRCSLPNNTTSAASWRPPPSTNRLAAFSTNPSAQFPAPAKKSVSMTGPPQKGVKKLRMRKKMRVVAARPPAPGERKALRKRVVLSNTNALMVPGLQDMNAQNITQSNVEGQVLGIPDQVIDQLRAVNAFKPTQGWRLFRRPASLMRKETGEMARLVSAVESAGAGKTIRKVIVGECGSGKSMLQLQAIATAFLKGWVVISIPEGTSKILYECRSSTDSVLQHKNSR